jgi:hypothetical protein
VDFMGFPPVTTAALAAVRFPITFAVREPGSSTAGIFTASIGVTESDPGEEGPAVVAP